jgi:RNA polymerase sigma-70 factor (ECF subfamily)
LSAERIAKVFVVPAVNMSQRLVRAKKRIRDLAIPFQVPQFHELPTRLGRVLQAIYAVYGTAWEDISFANTQPHGLAFEAVHLARVLVQLLPQEPEPLGLLALILHCEARRKARINAHGEYVPLLQQQTHLWDVAMMTEAEACLWRAAEMKSVGRFQLEAAIQSAHNQRARSGRTPWPDILNLYEQCLALRKSLGAIVAYAAALVTAGHAESGMQVLAEIPAPLSEEYQPYWATRMHALAVLGHHEQARAAREKALAITSEPSLRKYLLNTDVAQ